MLLLLLLLLVVVVIVLLRLLLLLLQAAVAYRRCKMRRLFDAFLRCLRPTNPLDLRTGSWQCSAGRLRPLL